MLMMFIYALSFSVTDSYAVTNIAMQGEYKVILDSIKTHSSNADVVANGFQALQVIAR